jgi:hypothetical protein
LWWPLFFLLLTQPYWAHHELLKYHCDNFEHVVQRWTVCIRSLIWLNSYLLKIKFYFPSPQQMFTRIFILLHVSVS